MSKIKLLNNQGDEVTIEHSNTSSKQGNSVVNIKDVTKQVDTIADLKALDGTHKLVYATGYHTAGDGAFGSHFFEWDANSTEDDNGGTIIKLDSVDAGRYKLKYDGSVNVKWFGAVGDGVTDDTEAIQHTIDIFKDVFIPKGIYKITYQLIINEYNNIRGEGKESYGEYDIADKTSLTVLKLTGFTTGQYGVSISGRMVHLRHLSIEGDYTSNGIVIGDLKRELVLDSVSVKYVQTGIYSTNAYVASFKDVTVTAQNVGIEWSGGTTLNFINVGIQGDPRVGRINVGLKFNGSLANAKMNGGFIQHMNTAVEISGQNVIQFDSWDFEDLVNDSTGTIFKLGDCHDGSLSIDNCNGVAGTVPEGQSIFRIVGNINHHFPIDISTFYHFVPAIGKLINIDGGSLLSPFYMLSYYYAKHIPQLGGTVDIQSFILIKDRNVYDTGSYEYTTLLTSTPIVLKNADGTDYDYDKGGIVTITVYGTSTDNTSCTYAIGRDGYSTYKLTSLAGNSSAASNRPFMELDSNNKPCLRTNNSNAYPTKVKVSTI